MDHPLYWRIGRPQALDEVTGTAVLEDVSAGESYVVDVDHSVDAEFALAEMPRVTAVTDVRFHVLADGTDGGNFRLLVELDAGFIGADYGYGYATADIIINWARRGILNGAA